MLLVTALLIILVDLDKTTKTTHLQGKWTKKVNIIYRKRGKKCVYDKERNKNKMKGV